MLPSKNTTKIKNPMVGLGGVLCVSKQNRPWKRGTVDKTGVFQGTRDLEKLGERQWDPQLTQLQPGPRGGEGAKGEEGL